MEQKKTAVQVQPQDNVASVFAVVSPGEMVEVIARDGGREQILSPQAIPYGHKIAVTDITCGETILKYGESIGIATQNIKKGDYVHVHNLDSSRARGDWKE